MKKIFNCIFFVCALILISSKQILADMGVPLIGAYLPPAWLALIPIIWIEAKVGINTFNLPVKKSFIASGVANLVTTILGIPLTWFIFVIGGSLIGTIDSKIAHIIYSVVTFPFWLPPLPPIDYVAIVIVFFAVTIAICLFFLMSVWIEYIINKRIFQDYEPRIIKSWMWRANIISYVCLLAFIPIINLLKSYFVWIHNTFSPITEWLIDSSIKIADVIFY